MLDFNVSFDFKGQTAVITGGMQGIGYTTATMFAQSNANVVLIDKSDQVRNSAEQIAKETGAKTLGLVADVTDIDSLKEAKTQCLQVFSQVDIIVNNAGIGLLDKAESISKEKWDATMAVNLSGPLFVTQTFVTEMIARKKGKIVNMGSQAAVIALDRHIAYCPSKAAVVSMTKVMALEWGKYNINVNAVSPTITNTELAAKAWGGKEGDDFKKIIPIGRFAEPEEVASAILFLSSNASDMIHGENLLIDGGYSMQ